jgi:hypothetical protein
MHAEIVGDDDSMPRIAAARDRSGTGVYGPQFGPGLWNSATE